MNLSNFFLLTFLHLICGYALLSLFKIKGLNYLQKIALSILIGLGLSSFIPLVLECFKITINKTNVFTSLIILSGTPFLCGARVIFKDLKNTQFSVSDIKLYDVLAVACICYLLYVGAYKCYYFPPTPRDLTSGAEGLAEFAVREGHINNSFLLQDLSTTNNHLKPPSVLGLQIIYKLLVQNFGQVWLIIVSYSFYLFFYGSLRKLVHPIFAGLFCMLSIAIPELYGYTIMVLFDFSNMVYVFAAFYFIYLFLSSGQLKYLGVGTLLFSIAVFFRAETLILAAFVAVLIFLWLYFRHRRENGLLKTFIAPAIIVIPAFITYYFSIEYFVKRVLVTGFNSADSVNKNILNLKPFFTRLYDIYFTLMFNSGASAQTTYNTRILFNETFNIFFIFVLFEIIYLLVKKRLNKIALYWLITFTLITLFIAFLGYLLPLADLYNTTKRALFKLIPVGFAFAASTSVMQYFSQKITNWENGISAPPIISKKKSIKNKIR